MAEKRTSGAHGTSAAGAGGDQPRRAGLFDIRVIIGGLLGAYGVILVLTALLGGDADVENADQINYLGGAGMLAVSIAFVLWARIRPIVVSEDPSAGEDAEDRGSSDPR